MKYYSEHTRQFYDSVEECEKAENELVEAKKKAELEAKAKSEAREKRAKEVEEAMKNAHEAYEKFDKLLKEFVKDYGSFHYSYTDKDHDLSFLDPWGFFFNIF
jgi:hypothetical protein